MSEGSRKRTKSQWCPKSPSGEVFQEKGTAQLSQTADQASNVRTENGPPGLAALRSRGTTLTENGVSGGVGRRAEVCLWNGRRGTGDTGQTILL